MVAIAVGTASYALQGAIDPSVFEYGGNGHIATEDMWFDGDVPKVFRLMTDRHAAQHGTMADHPLASTVLYWPAHALTAAFRGDAWQGVRVMTAAIAGTVIGLLLCALRLAGCRRSDSMLFAMLAATSSYNIFWSSVPEVFLFGSATILGALCLVAIADRVKRREPLFVLINSLTLSMTITNWSVGLLAAFERFHWRRAVQIAVNAFFIVSVVWSLQHIAFPNTEFFLPGTARAWRTVGRPDLRISLKVLHAFFGGSIVMPAVKVAVRGEQWRVLTVQSSLPGSGGWLGLVAVSSWIVLLGLGLSAALSSEVRHGPIARLVVPVLATQLALHLVFGTETFLYSPHFAPLLVVLASFATLTRRRLVALALAIGVTISGGVNNGLQFKRAVDTVQLLVSDDAPAAR